MYLGRIVEIGDTAEIFADPKHPYTKALLAAIPEPDPSRGTAGATCRGGRSRTPPAAARLLRSTRGVRWRSTSAAGSPGTCAASWRATG